jgi:hypothetical protein
MIILLYLLDITIKLNFPVLLPEKIDKVSKLSALIGCYEC